MDESEIGSANETAALGWPFPFCRVARVPHFRLPAFDRGVTSFLWALGLGLFVFFGLLAIGTNRATAFILGALSACAIFLFVRLYGDDVVDG